MTKHSEKHEQLIFDLPHHTALGLADFYESESNSHALRFIRDWPISQLDRRVIITGPVGCGKTHLAHVWMELTGAHTIGLDDKAIFNNNNPIAVIEDIDAIATAEEEEQLFHLLNHIQHTQGWLLMTSAKPIAQMAIALPDLESRLKNILSVAIDEPDDMLLRAILVKHFTDRQIYISDNALSYCLTHMERSFSAAADLVEKVARRSLAEQHPVTVPLIKKSGL